MIGHGVIICGISVLHLVLEGSNLCLVFPYLPGLGAGTLSGVDRSLLISATTVITAATAETTSKRHMSILASGLLFIVQHFFFQKSSEVEKV
jgi:hypothetical protein